jgi:hypothetical protein
LHAKCATRNYGVLITHVTGGETTAMPDGVR